MTTLIISLVSIAISLIAIVVFKRKENELINSFVSFKEDVEKAFEGKLSSISKLVDDKLLLSKINSIIGKEDRIIKLLKQAKEKGYFDKAFVPFNAVDNYTFNGKDVSLVNNELGECLFISGINHIDLSKVGILYQLPRVIPREKLCIYQNGRWAAIVETSLIDTQAQQRPVKYNISDLDFSQTDLEQSRALLYEKLKGNEKNIGLGQFKNIEDYSTTAMVRFLIENSEFKQQK